MVVVHILIFAYLLRPIPKLEPAPTSKLADKR